MIQVSSLSKAFGDRVLFENVDWQISKRDRIGLCGANGSGKTTLLRMLVGEEEPDAGGITKPNALTIGYLPQDGIAHAGLSVFEEASLAFRPLLELKERMHHLEGRLADANAPAGEHEKLLDQYSELQDQFRREEGYSIDLKVATVLRGLGFSQADFERETSTLSGGWQMRLALAKLLLGRPQLLLLDEPTNHLDLEARNWLEDYLTSYEHAIVLISHDRFFLDAVVMRVTEVGLQTLTDYRGSYSQYLVEREERIERLRQAKTRQDEEIARVKLFIDRFRYQATKAAQVQSRVKMLEKIVPIVVPPARKKVHFTFPECVRSGRVVIELSGARKAYKENVVFRELNLHVERGERIAIVGQNGAGKSTLMRMLSGVEAPDAGMRREGHQVITQYFAQDEADRLDPALTVYETLAVSSPTEMVPMIRNILGGFLFSGDDVYKRAAVLSGGERTRLAVARMLLRPSNTLLLDEPTNHLDLDSKDVLLGALADFGGTIIFVSHDRYFLDRLATKVVDVGSGEAVLFPGTYEEFHDRKMRRDEAPPTTTSESKAGETPTPKNAWEEQKRAAAEARKRDRAVKALQARVAEIESQIGRREQEIKDLEAAMAQPAFYDHQATARTQIERHEKLIAEVDALMHEWEELNTELAGID